jgi:TolB-like protein/predicted Ser/Thr protein kinase
MIKVIRICRKCGAKILSDAPEGLCAKCVLKSALGNFPDVPVAGGVDPGRTDTSSPADRNEAANNKKSARAAELLGELGDYELLQEVGRGGQGVVFRARQKSLNRTVALKVISLGQWASKAHLKRFRLEAEAAAKLEHPGIVPIHEVGERDGSCYFSMKFVEGGQLDEVARREPMPIRRAVELIAKVARTVHYAHEHGILHRDIKPGNILLDAKGEPHLTDFGLARLVESESSVTQTLDVIGTPSYMAPEQAVGNNAAVSRITDVYGLGAVLYQLLTGQPPFAGGTTYETIKLLLDTEPRQPRLLNPKIDRDLATICLKCLEKDPKRRYSSALALAEDLERWLKHEPILARHIGILRRGAKWVRRNPTSALLVGCLVALAAAAGWIVWKSEFIQRPITTGIAVLPFENLSDDKEHAFFADGVQDDILIKLMKIADLKVISRTSVMQYRGKQDVRQIGDELRVSHILEGTVRRSGGKVHVNTQLVDTRTDAGIWAEEFDRDLNDIFAIETEVAQSIANRLRAKVSAGEKMAMQEWPTKDLVAYDFYVRAVSIIYSAQVPTEAGLVNLSDVVDLLTKAVAHDPNFFLAYCQLAFLHDLIYQQEIDHTPARLALAKSAIDSAFRLRPDSAEAHLALSWHLYWGYADFDSARTELALAKQNLTNNPRAFELAGLIDRRQGRWADATQDLERACELDPRNLPYHITLATTYLWLHDYDQMAKVMDHIIVLRPDRKLPRLIRAGIERDGRADTGPLRAVIEKILTNEPGSDKDPDVTSWRFDLALSDRDLETAASIAAALPLKQTLYRTFRRSRFAQAGFNQGNRDFWLGVVARLKGDVAAARAAFVRARTETEEELRVHPDDIGLLSDLGLIDAALGRKQEALSEGRRAMELAPTVQEAMTGWSNNEGFARAWFAMICAWAGETDLALEQLEAVTKIPGGPNYGELRLNPMWDPLRGDPRFEKIVASLAPKETVSK